MRSDEEIGRIKRYVVTFVEYGDSVDWKARILDIFETREEAVAEMHAAARRYKDDLGLEELELFYDSASVGEVGECGCEYRIDKVMIPVYAGEIDDGKEHVFRATIELPAEEIRKWNELMSMDKLDYDALGFKPHDVVARWIARFPDGRLADVTVDTCEKDRGCYAEATLFDSDGSQVAFTYDPCYELDGKAWIMWAGNNEYHIDVTSKEKNEAEDRKED